MIPPLITPLLFFFLLSYFKIATHFNIIDKPNERSLHTKVTIRGGGIIFWFALFCYFIYSGYQHPYFFMGLTAVAIISFLDDIYTLPNRYRLPFQFLAILSILLELHLLDSPLWILVAYLIIGVGIINAYNFMDGINGLTGGYSLVAIFSFFAVNHFYRPIIADDFLYFIGIGLIVFNWFNFRKKAICFAGDVGSITMAVIVLFLIGKAILEYNNLIFIGFLAVYGVDSVLTILHRLYLKQNIFHAHRLHLFQVIVHHWKVPHLVMTTIYMVLQGIINIIIIANLHQSITIQFYIIGSVIVLLSLLYLFLKMKASSQK